eukprot:PhM_4_TR15501/c0_g1_i1/m.48382
MFFAASASAVILLLRPRPRRRDLRLDFSEIRSCSCAWRSAVSSSGVGSGVLRKSHNDVASVRPSPDMGATSGSFRSSAVQYALTASTSRLGDMAPPTGTAGKEPPVHVAAASNSSSSSSSPKCFAVLIVFVSARSSKHTLCFFFGNLALPGPSLSTEAPSESLRIASVWEEKDGGCTHAVGTASPVIDSSARKKCVRSSLASRSSCRIQCSWIARVVSTTEAQSTLPPGSAPSPKASYIPSTLLRLARCPNLSKILCTISAWRSSRRHVCSSTSWAIVVCCCVHTRGGGVSQEFTEALRGRLLLPSATPRRCTDARVFA